jgi:2'-5' RNA ligase
LDFTKASQDFITQSTEGIKLIKSATSFSDIGGLKDVKNILRETFIFPTKYASLFENEQYDVLKFDVQNSALYEINAKLCELPHTTNFPDYHPHATIGYLKPGAGKKYVEKFKNKEYEVTPNRIVYSKPNGGRIEESWN